MYIPKPGEPRMVYMGAAVIDACASAAMLPPSDGSSVPPVPLPPRMPSGCVPEGAGLAELLADAQGRVYVDDVRAPAPDLVAPPATAAATPQANQVQKKDAGKCPHELLPEDALEQVARVLEFGAKKYRARGWEAGIEYGRVYAAIKRHGKSWFQDREELDPETQLSHLAHLACEALFLLAFHLRGADGSKLDNRPYRGRFDIDGCFVPHAAPYTPDPEDQ
jgi:hypothetical protein